MPQVNLNVVEGMLAKLDTSMQQSAFPSVLYGESGSMQAGYGVSLLSDAAKGRIKSPLEYLEMAVMQVNEAVMALVETFDDDGEGVELWGKDAKDNKLYKLCMYGKDIGGYYENMVTLSPNLPQDDMQRVTMGLRLAESGRLSDQTFWDKWVNVPMPNDEADRIWAQKAMQSEELSRNMMLVKLMEIYPDSWDRIIKGTPFEQIAQTIAGPPPPPPPPPGMMGPDGMPMPGMPPTEPMPPGGTPPIEGMPPMGPPGMMGPPPPIQPPAMAMPMGGGIPPAMQGQLEAENLGLPPDMDPVLFAQLMGNPLAPQEELDVLAGGGTPR